MFAPHNVFKSIGKSGFTLVEMSIVLVIIGLIIGGILVGQDLIRAAETRAAASQIEKYNAAVNTFLGKYGGLPGDILSSTAVQSGFATRTGNVGHGDGDGLLKGGNLTGFIPADNASCGEISLFWNDLSTAGLIKGQYVGTDTGNVVGDCNVTTPATTMPPMTLNDFQMLVTVYGDDTTGKNYYYLICDPSVIDFAGGWTCGALLSPASAYMLDVKIDDGLPQSGSIQAAFPVVTWNVIPTVPVTPAAPANGVCVSNASGNPYNINPANGGNSSACSIRIQFN